MSSTTTKRSLSDSKYLGSLRQPGVALAAAMLAPGAVAAVPPSLARDTDGDNPATTLPSMFVEDAKTKAPTSPKFTQPLRDTPQTVVVIPNSVYVEQAATSLRDVLRNTPGITFQAGEGGNAPGDNLFIRGFGARNDVFIDGVRDPGVLTRDTYNVEQVEVAKGPSSATSGRGSTGGSVNLITKTPRAGDFFDLQATAGNASYGRVTVDANHELPNSPIPGTAVRLNAVWMDAGVPGRDVVKNRSLGVAPSLALGLGTPTTLTLAYQHLSQDNIPDYGLPGTLPAVALADGKTQADLDWNNFYGLRARDYERIESDSATAIVEHKFSPDVSLRNLTRYGRNSRDAVVTPPRAAAAANAASDPGFDTTQAQIRRTDTKYQDRDDEIIANQTDFTARFTTGSVRHSSAVGFDASRENQKTYTRADSFAHGRPPVTDLYHPNPDDPYQPAISRTGARGSAVADSGAFYAFDSLEFGKQWQLNLGGRYEVFDVAYTAVDAAGASSRFQRTDDMFSWRTGIVFKPVPSTSLYGGYGTSFNPSADAAQGLVLAGAGTSSASLAPEENRSTELGVKWDFKQRLALTAALFRTEKVNARTTDAAGNTTLAGDQRVEGLELGASGKLTQAWTIFAGYAYMDSSVRASGISQQVDAALQYVPRHSFNLWTTYLLPIGLTIGGGAQYVEGYFFALPTATAPSVNQGVGTEYTIYNAMLAYDLTKHLTLRLNVNNLANKRYIDRGYNGHIIPAPGRALLLTAELKF